MLVAVLTDKRDNRPQKHFADESILVHSFLVLPFRHLSPHLWKGINGSLSYEERRPTSFTFSKT
jgi:hypothetical protein